MTPPPCEVCGTALSRGPRGRPPRYCSQACRARAYRLRVAAGPQAETLDYQQPDEDPGDGPLTASRIVRSAIAIADREGLAGLSMRRTAAELDVGVMSLYRHVRGWDELVDLMVDAIFGARPLPEPGPDGWRAKLELSVRSEWGIYRDHNWAAQLVAATTRPPIATNLMAYTDWRMRALDGNGLDFGTLIQTAILVSTYTQSAALSLAKERSAAKHSTREQWTTARRNSIDAALRKGKLPMVARFGTEAEQASEPDNMFEFGLHRMLDGVAVMLGNVHRPDGRGLGVLT